MPSARASSAIEDSQHRAVRADHQRQLGVRRPVLDDQVACLRIDPRGRPRDAAGRCGVRKVCRRTTSCESGEPISTGPLAPVSIRPTRRRISARTMRSPSSASATSSRRRSSGSITSASTSPSAWPSTRAGRPDKRPDLGQELAGTLIHDRRDVSEAVALGDGDVAADDDEHAAADVAGPEQQLAVAVAADRSEASQPLDFRRRQLGKHLIVA